MKQPTIFVSIASYRDDQCETTLHNLYERAKHPSRVFVGICQQNKDKKEECHQKPTGYESNIRILRMSHKKAKGPTFARYLCATLFQDEDFFFQIDSHCLFVRIGMNTRSE